MKKFFFSLFAALLLSVAAVAGEIDVLKEKRVANFPSGCCVWASLETLGNVHGVEALKGITKYRHDNYSKKQVYIHGTYVQGPTGLVQIQGPHYEVVNEAPGTPERVTAEMTRLKVDYKMQTDASKDLTLLKDAVSKNLGAAVGFKDFPNQGNYHMVALTDLTDEKVVFVDNRDCARYEASRAWFDAHWSGYTIVVYPPRPTVKEGEGDGSPQRKELLPVPKQEKPTVREDVKDEKPQVRETTELPKPEVKEDRK